MLLSVEKCKLTCKILIDIISISKKKKSKKCFSPYSKTGTLINEHLKMLMPWIVLNWKVISIWFICDWFLYFKFVYTVNNAISNLKIIY